MSSVFVIHLLVTDRLLFLLLMHPNHYSEVRVCSAAQGYAQEHYTITLIGVACILQGLLLS